MPKTVLQSLVLALLLFAGVAVANEAVIRKALTPKLGGRIDGVQPSEMPGLWEVRVRTESGMQVLYTDATGSYLIQGNIHDLRNDRNLTEDRLRRLNAIKFESLPLDQAVKIQRGSGRRVLAMFSDPYCPYCQQFEQTLQKLDDVTLYVFMYPVIRPQNADHSKAVWCSPDRPKAWLDLALQGRRPTAAPSCDNPVDKILELGRTLRVQSTPTVILSNGERFSGGLRAPELREMLDKAAAAAATKR